MITKIFISILFIPMFCFGQGRYINITNFPDQRTIEKIKNENLSQRSKILVYQPSSENSEVSSVLIIHKNDTAYFWIIRHDTIVKSGTLRNDDIFTYKDYLKTGATKKEDKLSFVPPLMNGVETVNLIYEDPKVKFYFEFGKNVTGYCPDPRYERYRSEWMSIIKVKLLENQIL